jgi:sugar phosphate isomerase/epimerase
MAIPFKDEINFSRENGFDIVQLWYKQGVISMAYEEDPISAIQREDFPVILHAAFDINDFNSYRDDIISVLKKLNHKELILHPMIKTEEVNDITHQRLVDEVLKLCQRLYDLDIVVYVENNHAHMKSFYYPKQWKEFFEKAPPNVELLIDFVHVL